MKILRSLALLGCIALSPAVLANPPPGSGYVQTNQTQSFQSSPGSCSTTVTTTYTWTNHSTGHVIQTTDRYEVYDEACGPIPS